MDVVFSMCFLTLWQALPGKLQHPKFKWRKRLRKLAKKSLKAINCADSSNTNGVDVITPDTKTDGDIRPNFQPEFSNCTPDQPLTSESDSFTNSPVPTNCKKSKVVKAFDHTAVKSTVKMQIITRSNSVLCLSQQPSSILVRVDPISAPCSFTVLRPCTGPTNLCYSNTIVPAAMEPESTVSSIRMMLNIPSRKSSELAIDCIETAYLNGGIVGLVNIGNTCYMNSVMQCLSHTLELTDLFLCNNYTSDLKVCSAYKKAMQRMWLTSTSPIRKRQPLKLHHLKKTVAKYHDQFGNKNQHDAQEFLTCLLLSIHNEQRMPCPPEGIPILASEFDLNDRELGLDRWNFLQSTDRSPVADIFMGQFKNTITCQCCGFMSRVFEPFWSIGLPLNCGTQNLCDCFRKFTEPETMDGKNQPTCACCLQPQTSTKQLTIQKFPRILVIYLQRFIHVHGWKCHKQASPVDIPLMLELAPFASRETLDADYQGRNISYKLYGMVDHYGDGRSGHYTAQAKHFASQQWYNYDDKSVCRQSEAASAIINGNSVNSKSAYVLFYRQAI